MPERIDRKTFIELASLGTAGFFAHSSGNVSSSYSESLKSARSPQQMTTVDNIACLGNGQLAVYESGADIMQVFGPPYSTPSAMDFRLDTSDIFIRIESQREANTAIWKHVLFSSGRKIGQLIDFVVAEYPAFIRQIRISEQINFYGTIPEQNSWLEDKSDFKRFDISGAGLSRVPAGSYIYSTYPIPKECCYQVITKGHSALYKFSQGIKNKIALKCEPGKSTFYIIGGPSYPECVDNTDQLLHSSWDQLLSDTRAYWHRFSSKRVDFANKISAQVSQRKNLLQAIDDVSIIIKTQQSEQGAVLAGHNYHLGYVRDQYGVSRGLLKLGYIHEAKKILQFYFNIWQQKGTLHNAQGIGIDAFHVHENDEVEITAYLILQAFDYYRESNDKAFLKEIFPMLEWAYYSQIKHLKKYMLPFNGDETYVAGGILPRATLLHGSAESTLLFITSADLLIQWAEKTSSWNSKVIIKQKKLVAKAKAHYHKNFIRNGKLITNNPIRMEGTNYPEFRHGVCESLVPPCEVFGWTQKTVNNRYLCPTCYATKAQTFPPADPQIYFLLSVSLLPLYIHSNILSDNEINALIKSIEKRYKKTGSLPSRPDGNSTVGYDYGLLLYSLTKLGHPLANQVYKRMLSVVDQTGAWVEYYHDDEPMGTRYRPWESAINLEAAICYAENFMPED